MFMPSIHGRKNELKKVLTIAGSDSSGGAGIQADIKTMTAHKMYAMSAITALTAQNTTGVYGILEADADFVSLQLQCIFEDIFPDAVKIGMVANKAIIWAIAGSLTKYKAVNIVVDPVMVSTSGSKLLSADASEALLQNLLPLADIITPNIPEAEMLSGVKILGQDDMLLAAKKISAGIRGAVLIKGGHLTGTADDLLYHNGIETWFCSERVDNPNTHGTGCTLSSAIACNLAAGRTMQESVKNAKAYITGALKANLDLGQGSGPLDHCFCI
jgi:hydroxymethylpyrimidine/phosphomethylpyrimidine kinase